MNIDQVITNAFMEAVPGEGIFVVEGNPTTNVIRILPADKAMMDITCTMVNCDFKKSFGERR